MKKLLLIALLSFNVQASEFCDKFSDLGALMWDLRKTGAHRVEMQEQLVSQGYTEMAAEALGEATKMASKRLAKVSAEVWCEPNKSNIVSNKSP